MTLVEDTRTGQVVSTMCLIPQTWTYAGIPFAVGRPEAVATHSDYRKRGLGMKMIRVLIDLALKQGLNILLAEVMAEQTKVVKAFEQLGFKSQATLDDYFIFPDGETRDVVLMTMPLRQKSDDF